MKAPVQRIAIGSAVHTAQWLETTRAGQSVLAAAQHATRRPRCMCVPDGVEMYVGRRGDRYYLSRMPGSGFLHAERCSASEDLALFSGACAYAAGAIVEESDGTLRLHANIECRAREPEPVAQVSIDGLLDVLIEQANLNRLATSEGPRTWTSVRDRLAEAAQWLKMGTTLLTDTLFVPVRYTQDNAEAGLAACEAFLSTARGRALICAPLKEFRPTTYSWQIVLKHLPRLRLWIAREAAEELEARWGTPYFAEPPAHALCLVATRPGRRERNFTVSNMACLPTDERFLPTRTQREAAAAARLVQDGSPLLRPLRFDCNPARPLADFALLDSYPPEPVFMLSPTGHDELDAAKRSLVALMQRNHARVRVVSP